jgi:hypothetical protein
MTLRRTRSALIGHCNTFAEVGALHNLASSPWQLLADFVAELA